MRFIFTSEALAEANYQSSAGAGFSRPCTSAWRRTLPKTRRSS